MYAWGEAAAVVAARLLRLQSRFEKLVGAVSQIAREIKRFRPISRNCDYRIGHEFARSQF